MELDQQQQQQEAVEFPLAAGEPTMAPGAAVEEIKEEPVTNEKNGLPTSTTSTSRHERRCCKWSNFDGNVTAQGYNIVS